MKTIAYTPDALKDLRTHRGEAKRLMGKIATYAETGAGSIKRWENITRLRVGDFRVIFVETETTILVTKIGPRGSVYE